jgi:hypothetical protein
VCISSKPGLSFSDSLRNAAVNPAANTNVDSRLYKPFTDPVTEWAKTSFDPWANRPVAPPEQQAPVTPDVNTIAKARTTATRANGAFGSLMPATPTMGSGGASLLGG